MPAMLVIFSGLPGSGKTTIARELTRCIGAVHLRIDSIEQAIRSAETGLESMRDTGYRVGYAVAGDNLRLGLSVLADSVNPLPVTRDAWRAVASCVGVRAFDVEIVCSDESEHRRRVEERRADIAEFRLPSWEEVRRRDYRPWSEPRVVVDTAGRSVESCVAALRAALPGG